jgi:alkanesulfonate monooxygenase SsuD/methylene tetrahydromethanopterin reductase-like flavin-dependent oxidoreductase (luciferase family)
LASIKLAGEAAMTDIITNGRLDIGIARGAYSFEYERMVPGMDAWSAGQRLREMIPAIKNLWKGDYEHNGEFWQFPKTTSAPQPLQQPYPPIWVAARDPNSHEFAVQNGCNVQVTPLHFGDEEVENSWDISIPPVKSLLIFLVLKLCYCVIPMSLIVKKMLN